MHRFEYMAMYISCINALAAVVGTVICGIIVGASSAAILSLSLSFCLCLSRCPAQVTHFDVVLLDDLLRVGLSRGVGMKTGSKSMATLATTTTLPAMDTTLGIAMDTTLGITKDTTFRHRRHVAPLTPTTLVPMMKIGRLALFMHGRG